MLCSILRPAYALYLGILLLRVESATCVAFVLTFCNARFVLGVWIGILIMYEWSRFRFRICFNHLEYADLKANLVGLNTSND